MDHPPFTLKKLSVEHLDQSTDLLRYAFQVTDNTLRECGWEDEEIKQSKSSVLERANVWGYFDGETLVSQFASYPLEMNIHSVIYPIAFITSVSTYPEYSGIGLMSKLMKRSLTEMRENGQSLALLCPYSIPLYRKKGWEIVSDKMSFSIREGGFPIYPDVPGYVRRVPRDDKEFTDLHMQFAKRTHGCLFRNYLVWDKYWRWDEDDMTVALYYRENGVPGGYMVYLIKNGVMYVKEMIYLDRESKKGLWNYISAHESMITKVRGYHYFSEPIAFDLEDSDIKETIRPYIMGRIVDVEQFLEKYRFNPDVHAEFTLNISDPILEWNNRSITLAVSDGKAVQKDGTAEHGADLSIGTLTTLLLGYKRASELAALERLCADPSTIHLLDQVFISRKPYISDYI
ncbi:MAG: GNAT family N-acetyltransferase [Methanocorpusculum sp.]|nr:GNAT family N-acetyltransferase [Methanocorpusculum sp.]